MSFKKSIVLGSVAGAMLGLSNAANAIPILQLYIEGSTYDEASESWIINTDFSSPITLWAIGNVAGEGGKGTIYDVKLAVAYDAGQTPAISLTSSTTGGLGGFTDPSTPSAPTYVQTVTDGSTPIMGDGNPLASHGEYGAGTWWQEFALGDFNLTDSPIADFINAFPTAGGANEGQINVYEINVTGATTVHFDLYDHVQSTTRGQTRTTYTFAPFSHDAGSDCCTEVSEPDSFALLGLGLLGLIFARRRLA